MVRNFINISPPEINITPFCQFPFLIIQSGDGPLQKSSKIFLVHGPPFMKGAETMVLIYQWESCYLFLLQFLCLIYNPNLSKSRIIHDKTQHHYILLSPKTWKRIYNVQPHTIIDNKPDTQKKKTRPLTSLDLCIRYMYVLFCVL